MITSQARLRKAASILNKRSSPLRAHILNRLLNGKVIFRRGFWLRPAAFEQRGALLAREGLTLAENEGAFVKLDIERVARLELGVFAQLVRDGDF